MRMTFRLPSWWPTDTRADGDYFDLVNLNYRLQWYAASVQDLYVRAFSPASDTMVCVHAFRTLADAEASEWVGSAEEIADEDNKILASSGLFFPVVGEQVGQSFANGGYGPDMSGLAMDYVVVTNPLDRWDAMFARIGSPALLVTRGIENILEEYTATGAALDGFAKRIIRGKKVDGTRGKGLFAALGEDESTSNEGSNFRVRVGLEIQVGVAGQARRGDQAWEQAKAYADQVRSILADERRTLDGLVSDLKLPNMSEPQQMNDDSSSTFMVCLLTGYADMVGRMDTDRTAL